MPINVSQYVDRLAGLCAALLLPLFLTACVATAPPQIERPAELADDALLEQGIQFAVDDLLAQASKTPGFQPPAKSALEQLIKSEPPKRALLVLDSSIDGATGQQTAATRLVDAGLVQALRQKLATHDVAAITEDNVKRANYLVTATLAQAQGRGGRGAFKLDASLTDMRSGFVIAQAVARVRPVGIDETPTQFFRESPAVSKDRGVDGQIKTAQMRAGGEADGLYLSRLPVNALFAEGDKYFEQGRCEDALKYFDAAAARRDGQQLRILNGIYLCQSQLNRIDAAEVAFGRIVALGLATNNLSVRFYFRPGTTEFIADAKFNQPYPMWLRQISKESAAAKVCLLIVGHTSKTGAEQVNDRLSLQRATTMQRRLEAGSADLMGRIQALGMGYRENIVGTGTDDLRDALDRRVEFKVRPC